MTQPEGLIKSNEELESVLGTQESRINWLNDQFLLTARSHPDNQSYITVESFNLKMDPAIRRVMVAEISHQLSEISTGDEVVYGIPAAGKEIGALVADALYLPTHIARKGSNIPGSWKNVLTVESPSYTTPSKIDTIQFGFAEEEMKAILVDDALATGNTTRACIEAFRKLGVEVVAVAAMFAKGFEGGIDRIKELEIPIIVPVVVERIGENGQFVMKEFE